MLLAGVVLLTIGIILMFSFEPLFVKNVEVLNDCQDEYGSGDIVMVKGIIHREFSPFAKGGYNPDAERTFSFTFEGLNASVYSKVPYDWDGAYVWAWLVKTNTSAWKLTNGGDIGDLKYPGYIVSSIGAVAMVAGMVLKPKAE